MPLSHFPVDQNQQPSWLPLSGGLNLKDNILRMTDFECSKLAEMVYNKGTLIKREAFTQYSTQDFSAETPFTDAIEYTDQNGNKRLLFGTDTGKIIEYLTSSTSAERVTGLGTTKENRFATMLGRCVHVNGSATPRVGNGTTWRVFGAIAPITTLAVAASGTGSFTGTWLHIVIPVKEISANVAEIYADWSNIITTTAASDAQFDLTWTDIVDTRIDKYWVFRTKDGVKGPFWRVARVNTGVQAYTDTTTDANLSEIKSPLLSEWGVAPTAKYVTFAGGRCVMAHLLDNADEENAFVVSKVANSVYDVEAFDTTRIYCPKDGPIKGILAVGDRGEDLARANHTFIAQDRAVYFLPETDPKQRIVSISEDIGLIHDRAIVQWESYIFWVDARKGLMYWQIGQARPWKIGEKIDPIFFGKAGGGHDTVTANTADDSITLNIWEDKLQITIQDDNTKTDANKVYLMDLDSFTPIDEETAKRTAIFTGPWTGPGFAFLKTLIDGTNIVFDNQNSEILKNNATATQDYIGGTLTNVKPHVRTGAILKNNLTSIKDARYLYLFHFSQSVPVVKLLAEYGKLISTVTMTPVSYEFVWDDIDWDDISWAYDVWQAEGACAWDAKAKWFQIDIYKDDLDVNYALFGPSMKYIEMKNLIRTYN